METQKKDVVIPRFSFMSALLLLGAGLLGGVLLPYLFYAVGWSSKVATLLFLPLLISLSIAYGQCFIETKLGICKRFWLTLGFAFVILFTLSYFWLFKGFVF